MEGWVIGKKLQLIPAVEDALERSLIEQRTASEMRDIERAWPNANALTIRNPELVRMMRQKFKEWVARPIAEICAEHRNRTDRDSERPPLLNSWLLICYCRVVYLALGRMIRYRLYCKELRHQMYECAESLADALDSTEREDRGWNSEFGIASSAFFRFVFSLYADYKRSDCVRTRYGRDFRRWWSKSQAVVESRMCASAGMEFVSSFRDWIAESMGPEFDLL